MRELLLLNTADPFLFVPRFSAEVAADIGVGEAAEGVFTAHHGRHQFHVFLPGRIQCAMTAGLGSDRLDQTTHPPARVARLF